MERENQGTREPENHGTGEPRNQRTMELENQGTGEPENPPPPLQRELSYLSSWKLEIDKK